MRIAVLCDPRFRDENRVIGYVTRLAEKHPDAIVLTAGVGGCTYQAERAALAAGLRVAALRVEVPQPGYPKERRFGDDGEPLPGTHPPPPPKRYVGLHELRPDVPEHRETLHTGSWRIIGELRGDEEAERECVRLAVATAHQAVAFTGDAEWAADAGQPRDGEIHRVGI